MKKLLEKIYSIFGDKALHLIAGFVVAFVTFWYTQLILLFFGAPNFEVSMSIAIGITALFGGGKELVDYLGLGTADKYDFIYTFIGGIGGIAINLLFMGV